MKTWWRRQSELDEDQKRAIQLSLDGNYLVTGPPGSGKTNILVLRGVYISSSGHENVNLITYTRVLREFIATGCGDHINFPAQQVFTFASWAEHLIRQRSISFPDDFRDLPEHEARMVRLELLNHAVQGLSRTYFDSLIVDEVQDLKSKEIEILSKLTSRLFMAGDSRQRIFDDEGGLIAAKNILGVNNEIELVHHYRIGPEICEAADRIRPSGPPLTETENYHDKHFPSRVALHEYASFNEQCMGAVETIKTQLRTYAGDWIGIIVNRKEQPDIVAKILTATDLAGATKILRSGQSDLSFDPNRPVCILTLPAAKGTEFRAVHWLGTCDIPHYTREKAFTAITRAKTALDVYHSDALEPELRSALKKRRPPEIGLPE